MRHNFILNNRTSHPLSKLIRPVFEKKWIKTALGGMFSITTLASGMVMAMPTDATLAAASIDTISNIQIETVRSFANVLPNNTGISQTYHWGHPGMDITAPLGTTIFPLKNGVVIRMENLKWDYGRAVYVDHGNGLVSLYAHMGKVFVEEGEHITTDTPIGEVGLTGRTTGPHLHFELRKNDQAVNPTPFMNLGLAKAR